MQDLSLIQSAGVFLTIDSLIITIFRVWKKKKIVF